MGSRLLLAVSYTIFQVYMHKDLGMCCNVEVGVVIHVYRPLKASLVPSPTPSFSSLAVRMKRGGPGTSSHVSMT